MTVQNAIDSPVVKRFLEYVTHDTASVQRRPGEDNKDKKVPSSDGQIHFVKMLLEEVVAKDLVNNASLRNNGSLLVHLPATNGLENASKMCYVVHVDTYPGQPGKANPQIHLYEGGDIELAHDDVVIPATDLVGLEGMHVITSDGSSLLGGDNKNGVAGIMTVIDRIIDEDIPHGELYFWFCTDEEIGEVDPEALPDGLAESLDGMVTVDGGRVGTVDIGCFIGRMVQATFTGADSHPGEQPDKLKPAHYAATLFASKLLDKPTPMTTSGDESFWYFVNIEGGATKASIMCIPRTFNAGESEAMGEELELLAQEAAETYGVKVDCKNVLQYRNTEEAIRKHPEILEVLIAAHREFGIEATKEYIRGRTDGAMINIHHPNLPAPNIGTGCANIHGRQEFVVAEELALLPELLLTFIKLYSQMTV